MAYVAMTQRLIDSVKDKIQSMARAEIEQTCPRWCDHVQADASELYNKFLWKEHLPLLDQIPKSWLHEITECNVVVKYSDDQGVNFSHSVVVKGLLNAYSIPRPNSYYGFGEVTLSEQELNALPQGMPGVAEIKQNFRLRITRREICDRWEQVSDKLLEFLRKCKSLNEAVKLVPSVRMYLSREDLERLDRKVERAKPGLDPSEALDDTVGAAAVAAKLMGFA